MSVEGITLRVVTFRGGVVESSLSLPFNPRFLRGGAVVDPDGLGGVIRQALADKGLGRGKGIFALPGLGVLSRVLTLPPVATGKLESVIPREARRAFALSGDTHAIHWQVLSGKTSPLRVFVLAVPKEPLLALAQTGKAAGLKMEAIDLKPLALARAVNQKNAVIVHGEVNCLEMVIMLDGLPGLMRSIFLGDEALAPEFALTRLLDELSRTLTYYSETSRENPLDMSVPVYLTGELASNPALAANVTTFTGRSVGAIEPPLPLPQGFNAILFMTNLGLILKTL